MKTILCALLTVFTGCHAVPVAVDTVAVRARLENTAKELEADKTGSLASLRGAAQLRQAADEIDSLSSQLNSCVKSYTALAKTCEESGGLMARRLSEFWHTTALVGGAFLIGTFLGRMILGMVWAALKSALRIG